MWEVLEFSRLLLLSQTSGKQLSVYAVELHIHPQKIEDLRYWFERVDHRGIISHQFCEEGEKTNVCANIEYTGTIFEPDSVTKVARVRKNLLIKEFCLCMVLHENQLSIW